MVNQVALAFVLFVSLAQLAHAQSSAAACFIGPNPCIQFQTILIQTTAGVTTVEVNVSNLCNYNVYYISFAMSSPKSLAMNPPMTLTAQIDTTTTYLAHYQWTVSYTQATLNQDTSPTNFLTFTPAPNTPGVSGNPPVQTAFLPNSATGWNWEIFSFLVTGYSDPTYPWYWQAHYGDQYETYGPLDMSDCYCANCDAGYFQRLIVACDLGYVNPTTIAYDDASTKLSESAFNENIVLYAFAVVQDEVQMFYSDEHPLIYGFDKVTIDGVDQTDIDFTPGNPSGNPILPQPPTSLPGICISDPIDWGNTNFNSVDPKSNVDANNYLTGCEAGPACGRPIPPCLFVTDTTDDPTSRAGDWQFGGTCQLPNKLCGTWKFATKVVTTHPANPNPDGSVFMEVITNTDPGYILRNSAGTSWNLGSGSDPLPIPSISANNAVNPGSTSNTGLNTYGAEIVWDFSKLNPPLNPSRNYRLQFMVHDGDQTRVGGDVGQACVGLTAACPPGYTGPNCTKCDINPPPGNAWTWYCFPTGTNDPVYNLIKIPTVKLTQPLYANSGGFIPGLVGGTDPAGYEIMCNCTRIIKPCPQNCCGNGVCDQRNGTCTCTQTVSPVIGTTIPTDTCCIPPIPPCYNGGLFCSGKGSCVNGVCNCTQIGDGSITNGTSCNTTYPPNIPCPNDCCANAVCNRLIGKCDSCLKIDATTNTSAGGDCCSSGPPKCYNNGQYCSGRGNCSSDNVTCTCFAMADGSTVTGSACNIIIPPPTLPCPSSCCGNGNCNSATGTCTCNKPASSLQVMNSTTCCVANQVPDCYNGGHYCSGAGTCVNNTCECNNGTTGDQCQIVIPPPPRTCEGYNASNCTDCLQYGNAYQLNCSWCPQNPNNTDTSLLLGTCSHQCNDAVSVCVSVPLYVPPPCPDHCSGNGVCTNVTNPNGTGLILLCVCASGWSGDNCGIGSNPAIVVAAALSGGAVVGIIICAILVLACAGGGAAAVVNASKHDVEGSITNNPMYKPNEHSGTNPMYKGGGSKV
jgi:hypothetical protein